MPVLGLKKGSDIMCLWS